MGIAVSSFFFSFSLFLVLPFLTSIFILFLFYTLTKGLYTLHYRNSGFVLNELK